MSAEIKTLLPLREKVSAESTDEGSIAAREKASLRKATTSRARSLRRTQPATERFPWKLLRDRRLQTMKFRRQVPIGPYVVDFACLGRRLIVEAHGPFHDAIEDAARDAWLATQGFRVLRFKNSEIASRDIVFGRIIEAAEAPILKRSLDPSSDPLRGPPSPARGEG